MSSMSSTTMFQIPEGASRFMMYGGGDGIGFSPFGEKRTEANSTFSTSNYFDICFRSSKIKLQCNSFITHLVTTQI